MADKSLIEWTDATWNPIRGCSRVSEGCRNCYAEKIAARFQKPGLPFEGLIARTGQWNGRIEVVREKLTQPMHWKKPRRIFVNSMSDLFHENVPESAIDQIFAVMALCPQHTFQVLTKRPARMVEYLLDSDRPLRINRHLPSSVNYQEPLPNVWLGVSIEDQRTANERIPLLLQAPAAVRWISAEPLLGTVDLKDIAPSPWEMMLPLAGLTWKLDAHGQARVMARHEKIDWVVVGGESGTESRPMLLDWVRSLRDQCVAAGVPFFFKQWGHWAPVDFDDDTGASNWLIFDRFGIPDIPDDRMPLQEFGEVAMWPAGKRKSGRLLDRREWNEFPKVQQ